MAGYDPQRTRHRPRPANGSAAPVDAILDGPADEQPPAEPATTGAATVEEPTAASEPAEPGAAAAASASASASEADQSTTPAPDVLEAPAVDLSAVPPPPPSASPARLVLVGGGLLTLLIAWLLWRRRSRRAAGDGDGE